MGYIRSHVLRSFSLPSDSSLIRNGTKWILTNIIKFPARRKKDRKISSSTRRLWNDYKRLKVAFGFVIIANSNLCRHIGGSVLRHSIQLCSTNKSNNVSSEREGAFVRDTSANYLISPDSDEEMTLGTMPPLFHRRDFSDFSTLIDVCTSLQKK